MGYISQWMVVVLVIAGLQLVACSQEEPAAAVESSHVEDVGGSDLSVVTLTARAAERLGVETVAVKQATVVRKRKVGGEVLAKADGEVLAKADGEVLASNGSGGDGSPLWVRVPAVVSDLRIVDKDEPAHLVSLAVGGERLDLMAQAVDHPTGETGALYYAVDAGERLVPGQAVRVELVVSGDGEVREVVPYSSLLYDGSGHTWVYVSPEALTYVREAVEVEYIEGDQAFLLKGPKVGTKVVSVGAAELFGTEFEVGH